MTFPGRLPAGTPPDTAWEAQPRLPAYNDQATCPACGHWEVQTTYCGGIVRAALPVWLPYLLRFLWPRHQTTCRYDARPHLHRVCPVCDYTWAERCVNDAMVEVWR